MPALPYLPENTQSPSELVAAIRARRGGKLLKLDRMLLNSPPFATAWNAFLGTVRNDLSVPKKIAELAICTVAILNKADYELEQHAPEFIKAGGSQNQLTALSNIDNGNRNIDTSLFSPVEQAVIDLTYEMTCQVNVSATTMEAINGQLPNNQQLIDLIATIATYNMVSRYLVALEIDTE